MSVATAQPTAERPAFVSTSQIAKELGVSYKTIRTLIATGQIAAVRVGYQLRVPASELDRLLKEAKANRPEHVTITRDDLGAISRLYRDSRLVITVGALLANANKYERPLSKAARSQVDALLKSVSYTVEDLDLISDLLEVHGERS